jgi:hypothetical protein
VSVVFIGKGEGVLKGMDDARKAEIFTESTLPGAIAFDHSVIITDYFNYLKSGKRPVLLNP